jgi:hypothetical protein
MPLYAIDPLHPDRLRCEACGGRPWPPCPTTGRPRRTR